MSLNPQKADCNLYTLDLPTIGVSTTAEGMRGKGQYNRSRLPEARLPELSREVLGERIHSAINCFPNFTEAIESQAGDSRFPFNGHKACQQRRL